MEQSSASVSPRANIHGNVLYTTAMSFVPQGRLPQENKILHATRSIFFLIAKMTATTDGANNTLEGVTLIACKTAILSTRLFASVPSTSDPCSGASGATQNKSRLRFILK